MSTLSGLAATPTTGPKSQRPTRRPRQHRHGQTLIHPVLHTPLIHGLLDGRICELSYASPVTGRHVKVQVMYARSGRCVFVLVPSANGGARWWRTFTTPYPVRVLLHRHWHQGLGRVVVYPHDAWRAAERAYRERFPTMPTGAADIFVAIALRSDP